MVDEQKDTEITTGHVGKPTADTYDPVKANWVHTEPKKAAGEVAEVVRDLEEEQPKRPDHHSPQTPTPPPVEDTTAGKAETKEDPYRTTDRATAIMRQQQENVRAKELEELKKERAKELERREKRHTRLGYSHAPNRAPSSPPQPPEQLAPQKKPVTLGGIWKNLKTLVTGNRPKEQPRSA